MKKLLLGLDLEHYSLIISRAVADTYDFSDFEGTFDLLEQWCAEHDVAGLVMEYGPATLSESEQRLKRIRKRLPRLPIIVLTYYTEVPAIVKKYKCVCSYIGSRRTGDWQETILTLVERAERLVQA